MARHCTFSNAILAFYTEVTKLKKGIQCGLTNVRANSVDLHQSDLSVQSFILPMQFFDSSLYTCTINSTSSSLRELQQEVKIPNTLSKYGNSTKQSAKVTTYNVKKKKKTK